MAAAKQHRADTSGDEAILSALKSRMRRGWPTQVNNLSGPAALEELAKAHRGPHADAKLEWWYVNGHVPSADVSFFAAFFRLALSDSVAASRGANDEPVNPATAPRVHAVNWAVTERGSGKYRYLGRVDPCGPQAMQELMEAGILAVPDPHLAASLTELHAMGLALGPDVKMRTAPVVQTNADSSVTLDFDGDRLELRADGSLRLVLAADAATMAHVKNVCHTSLDIVITPTKAPVLHGRDGVVSFSDADAINDMYYYFVPRCTAVGTVTLDGKAHRFTDGLGWIDHEFGGSVVGNAGERAVYRRLAANRPEVGWQWAAVQLDNDVELSLTLLREKTEANATASAPPQTFAVVREGTGPAYRVDDISFAPDASAGFWASPITSQRFATAWIAKFALADGSPVELKLKASTQDQEFITTAAKPSFWEGHAGVTGTWRGGATVKGDAFLEAHALSLDSGATTDAAEAAIAVTNAMLVQPGLNALKAAQPAHFRDAAPLLKPLLDAFAALVALQSPAAVPSPAVRDAMSWTIWALHRGSTGSSSGGASAAAGWDEAEAELTTEWRERLMNEIPNDPRRLLLRAWMFRVLADGRKEAGVAGHATTTNDATTEKSRKQQQQQEEQRQASSVSSGKVEHYVPAVADLTKLPTAEDVRTAQRCFNGVFVLDKPASDSLDELMAAEGASYVVRKMTDRLTPQLTTDVTAKAFNTHVKTMVSSQDMVTNIDGTPTPWFSSGRGNLVTQAALICGGQALYMRTIVPPEQSIAVEHKWMVAADIDAATGVPASLREVYRYDPTGSESSASKHASRIFRRVTTE